MTVFSVAATGTMSRDLVPLAAVQSIPPYKTSRPSANSHTSLQNTWYISSGYVSSVKKNLLNFFLKLVVIKWHNGMT